MSTKPAQEAELTGEYLNVKGTTIYRLKCPACSMPQWHSAGTTECIYMCSTSFVVRPFKVFTSGTAPEEES